MFTAAVFEERLWAFIGFLPTSHVEKNSGQTQLHQRNQFCCWELGNGKEENRILVDCVCYSQWDFFKGRK